MKRFNLLLLITLFSLSVNAGNPVSLVSGKKDFLKDNASATVSFSWDKAQWNDGGTMKEVLSESEFESYVSVAEQKFKEGFNLKSKRLTVKDGEDAKYAIQIEILKVDYFFSVMSLVPGHKNTVWANITVKDIATNEEVASIKVDRLKGARDFVRNDAFAKCFYALGEELAGM